MSARPGPSALVAACPPGAPGRCPADFAEAVLSLKLAREELLAGRLTLDELYARAGQHLEVAADYLAQVEGLQHAPVLLRRAPSGRRHMFSTPGVVKLYFTSGAGPRLAKVFNAASNQSYLKARKASASAFRPWMQSASSDLPELTCNRILYI